MTRVRKLLTTAGAALSATAAATAVGRLLDGLGTRAGEASRVLPGDELHGPEALVRTRAITIAAPPGDVWPWLVQLGWGRAGWYSLDVLERPLGAARSVDAEGRASRRSLTEVVEDHQDLQVGDTVPLRGDVGFEVVQLEEQRHLVGVYEGASLRMVWAMVLRDFDEATRLVVRTAFEATGTAAQVATRVLVDPGHAVMEAVQLRGIKRRAEGYYAPDATVR